MRIEPRVYMALSVPLDKPGVYRLSSERSNLWSPPTRGEMAERILADLNPAPHGGHQWARVTDTREGGRLFTCECGHQTRVSGPSATEVEVLAREVIRCAK